MGVVKLGRMLVSYFKEKRKPHIYHTANLPGGSPHYYPPPQRLQKSREKEQYQNESIVNQNIIEQACLS